jgi:cell division septation protein DedD
MKIICMDCQNETHLEMETLRDKKKMTCAHCEEKAQAAPAGKTDEWSAPPRHEEPQAQSAAADYAFEVVEPQVEEIDVLEIPERGLELYDPERAEAVAEEVVLYEPEIYPPLEALRADTVEDEPEEMIVSAAHDDTEPVPVFTPRFDSAPQFDSEPRYDFAPRQEAAPLPAPALLTEQAPPTEIVPPVVQPIAPPAETHAPGKVKFLKFSTASLAAGLTVFLAFIFFGDKLIKSSSDISPVAAAPIETKAKPSAQQTKKQAAVTAATPAPQPSATPAPTPEPTQAPTPEPTPAPQQAKQAETQAPPVDVQQSTAGGRFAVQVGSYNEVGQANERAEKLRAAGFDPRVVSVELPKRGTWFRVMVGSFNDRAEANRFGAQLRAKGAAQDFVIADL